MIMRNTAVTMAALAALGSAAMAAVVGATLVLAGLANVLDSAGRSACHVIPVDRIDYVQAQDDYVCFRSEGKDYLKEQTLAETEASLDPKAFVRIHRSCLLNLSRGGMVESI